MCDDVFSSLWIDKFIGLLWILQWIVRSHNMGWVKFWLSKRLSPLQKGLSRNLQTAENHASCRAVGVYQFPSMEWSQLVNSIKGQRGGAMKRTSLCARPMSSWEQSAWVRVQEAQDGAQFRGLVNKGFHEIGAGYFLAQLRGIFFHEATSVHRSLHF